MIAVCDGRRAYPLAAAQDYKRLGDDGTGPNTGGMGAYSPVPFAGDDVVGEVMERAVLPTLHALYKRNIDYRGALYAGVMMTEEGPKVLEFNVRFGDPEAQVAVAAVERGRNRHTRCRRLGHPFRPQRSQFLQRRRGVCGAGIPWLPRETRNRRAHRGPRRRARRSPGPGSTPPEWPSTRALAPAITSLPAGAGCLTWLGMGEDLAEARRVAYRAADMISWPGMLSRSDIAGGVE